MKLLFGILLFFSCLSCSQSPSPFQEWVASQGQVRVLSTTAMIDDLVGKVGGVYVAHLPLITGEIDPHRYELVKGDAEKFAVADLIFYNGLGLEHGASLRFQLQQHPHAISLGDHIGGKLPEAILKVDGQVDPHIWMDIQLWSVAVDPIVEALSKADPIHAAEYRENGERMKTEMLAVDAQILADLQHIDPNKRFLVTSHDAFHYFTRRYLAKEGEPWESRCVAPEGLAPEGQLSTTDIQNTMDHLLTYRIGVVFPEANVNRDALRKVVSASKEKGHEVRIARSSLYGDSMGAAQSSTGNYLNMMQHNAKTLVEEWAH